MHARADMDAREGRIMGFESRAISARVTKQIVTIFSKTCDNYRKTLLANILFLVYADFRNK